MYACHEAHAQASSFLVARYAHATVIDPSDQISQEETTSFINIDIDTIILLAEPVLFYRARWDFGIYSDGCY